MKKVSVLFVVALSLAAAAGAIETRTLANIVQINEDGFGSHANKYAFSMAEYEGSLYVGTLNIKRMPGMVRFFSGTNAKRATTGAEIWSYDGHEWTREVDEGLESYLNLGVRKMITAKGCLWAVTANHNEGMEVWRTCGRDNWEVTARGGFGDQDNTSGRGMGEFKGYIYIGTENRAKGAQLWRSKDGVEWEKLIDSGATDKTNWWFSDFVAFKDQLYTGTLNPTGMQLFRTSDGVNFEQVFKGGLEKFTNTAAMKLYVWNGRLWLSTMDFFQGFDLYASEDGLNFERVLKRGHEKHTYAYLWQIEAYNGRLYGGTYQHFGILPPFGRFAIFSTDDGENWITETDNAFGNRWYYGVRSTAVWDGKLVIGTASARYGCKIFTAEGKD